MTIEEYEKELELINKSKKKTTKLPDNSESSTSNDGIFSTWLQISSSNMSTSKPTQLQNLAKRNNSRIEIVKTTRKRLTTTLSPRIKYSTFSKPMKNKTISVESTTKPLTTAVTKTTTTTVKPTTVKVRTSKTTKKRSTAVRTKPATKTTPITTTTTTASSSTEISTTNEETTVTEPTFLILEPKDAGIGILCYIF